MAQEGAGEKGAGKGANVEREASKRRGGMGRVVGEAVEHGVRQGEGERRPKRARERRAQTHSECCWLSERGASRRQALGETRA